MAHVKNGELIKIVAKYCDKIRMGKHYVCYPKGLSRTITISTSPSDYMQAKQVYREFRRCGIEIVELAPKKNKPKH